MKWKQGYDLILAGVAVTWTIALGFVGYQRDIGHWRQTIVINERQQMTPRHVVTENINVTNVRNNVSVSLPGIGKRVGTISIPKLGILLPIGSKPHQMQALAQGAQQLSTASGKPGRGNFIVVAHNYGDGKTMFSALQQYVWQDSPYLVANKSHENNWLNGQHIYVATAQRIYDYVIQGQRVVKANDLSVVQASSKDEINLLTCLIPTDSYRIVTHGKLRRSWSWDQVPRPVLMNFDLNQFHYNLAKSR